MAFDPSDVSSLKGERMISRGQFHRELAFHCDKLDVISMLQLGRVFSNF